MGVARPASSRTGLTGRELRSTARARRARSQAGPGTHGNSLTTGGAPVEVEPPPPSSMAARFVKSAIDRIGALVLLLLCLPVLLVLAVVVKVSSPGPIFYRQPRVGLRGQRFAFLKFRTMIDRADELRPELLARNECDGLIFKIRDDPRVTGAGKVMRRLSLDELPQLWHVLVGDMSLVGPRPPLPTEVSAYDARVARRLTVKPGLTGLWQVSGRSNLSWEESVQLDLHYVEHWSLRLDLAILCRTLPAVLTARGAY